MIQVKTVSHFDAAETDEAEFEKFRKLLDRLYPVTGGIGQRRRIGRTGILYRIPGRETEGDPAVLMLLTLSEQQPQSSNNSSPLQKDRRDCLKNDEQDDQFYNECHTLDILH